MTRKQTTDQIAELALAHAAESDPRKRGAITRQINALQKQVGVSTADRTATAKGLAKKEVKPDPKPAAKKSGRKPAAKPAAKKSAPARKPAAAKTENASQPLVWQGRLDGAISQLKKKGCTEGVITTCPTPKTATGTADKVRKLLAAGRITPPAGTPALRVKSHGAAVVAMVA